MGNGISCDTDYTIEKDGIQNYSNKQETVQQLRSQCTLLIQQCKSMSTEIEKAKERLVERHTAEIGILKDKYSNLIEENEELSAALERKEQKLRSETATIKILTAENEKHRNTINALQNENRLKDTDLLSVRDELGECVMNVEEMRDENYTLEKKIEEASEKHEKYTVSVKEIIHTLNDRISDITKQCEVHERKIESDAEIIEAMTKDIVVLKEEAESRKIEKSALVEEYNNIVNEVDGAKEELGIKMRLLHNEREKTIAFKKLNVSLKHELKTISKKYQKKGENAVKKYIFQKLKELRTPTFQKECLRELMDETWIPNNLEEWFYEDIFAHIMMNVHNVMVDE